MTIEGLQSLLGEHPFFAGMAADDLALMAGCARNVRFDAGDYLLRDGEEATEFFLIRSGSVSVEAYAAGRGTVSLATVGEGGIVGFSWLLPPHRWMFDARCVVATRALVFDGACLRAKCDADPRLGYELMKRVTRVMNERMQTMRMQLLDVYGDAVTPRDDDA